MCLDPLRLTLYRARRPIGVFKFGTPKGAFFMPPYFSSRLRYRFGAMASSPIRRDSLGDIAEGLHSYVEQPLHLLDGFHATFCGSRIHPAVIPKGAYFVVGKLGDLASTHLIVLHRPVGLPKSSRLLTHPFRVFNKTRDLTDPILDFRHLRSPRGTFLVQ